MFRDDRNSAASDAVNKTDKTLFSDDGYNSQNAGKSIPSNFDDSGYESPNKENYNDPEFQQHLREKNRGDLMARAKKMAKRGKALTRYDTPENREKAKEYLAKKARKKAQDALTKRITNEGVKKGIQKGLSSGAKNVAKEGAKKATKEATKKVVETGTKAAAKGAGKVASQGLNVAVDVAGGAAGFETFGLGFIVAFLLNIAITLGVGDAVDAAFELAHGNAKQALFLVNRAAAKVGTFFYILIMCGFLISIGGLIFGVPMLIAINIYMILGKIFPKRGLLQGVVWWELIPILIIDFFAFLFTIVFVMTMGWYLCKTTGLGQGGVSGAVTSVIVSAYDWWNETTAGSVAQSFCKFVTGIGEGGSGTGSSNGSSSNSSGSGSTAAVNGPKPFCIPVQGFLCDHPAGFPSTFPSYPDPASTRSSNPEIQTNITKVLAAVKELQKKHPNVGILQLYRPHEYGAHMRSVFEAGALMRGMTEEQVKTRGFYCDGSIQYVKKSDLDNLSPSARAYIDTHWNQHNMSTSSSYDTTCLSDHGFGYAVDLSNATSDAVENDAEAVGLCHNLPGDTNHYVLKDKNRNNKGCNW